MRNGSRHGARQYGRWLLVLAALCLGGCTTFIARQIEYPPHDHVPGSAYVLEHWQFARDAMHTHDGVRIDYWYGLARAYDISSHVVERREPKLSFSWEFGAKNHLSLRPIRGSIILLRGVMALEPYANAAAVIHHAVGNALFGYTWLAGWIDADEMDKAIARASRQLGVDLTEVDAGDAVARATACTLIVHGSEDHLTSADALRAVARRSPRARFVSVPKEGHGSLPLRGDRLFQPLLHWMQAVPARAAWLLQPMPGWTQTMPTTTDRSMWCSTITPLPFAPAPAPPAPS